MDIKSSQRFLLHRLIAIVLIGFTFGMSALVSQRVFERLPHLEDEVAYLYQARLFARGQATVETPEPRRAFWQPFVVDYNGNRFGKYTPGWSLVLSTGVLFGQAWVVNALLAALTLALVFRLGSEIFNPDVGVIAAALVAFSPMALLLNGSLMGHTSALFYVTVFIYAYWRLQKQNRLWWGVLAGLMLGMLAITRPLSAIALAMPFVAWSGLRVLMPLFRTKTLASAFRVMWQPLKPLLMLSVAALALATLIPLFNQAATGDASQNLYELVWSYDRIGFGECCGRNGHRLEKAYLHTRYDLSLTAADLFGWQVGDLTPQIEQHWLTASTYYPNTGLSFFLIPFGVLVGILWRSRTLAETLRRVLPLVLWTTVTAAWIIFPLRLELETIRDPGFSWMWVIVAAGWLLLPMVLLVRATDRPAVQFTWLLLAVMLSVVLWQMTYWIGSQRYSTRYYYEALVPAAMLSALPLAWLARLPLRLLKDPLKQPVWRRSLVQLPVYALLAVVLVWSLKSYSEPRISVLHGFNNISRSDLAALEARRSDDTPVLVLVTATDQGEDRLRWRAMGSYMTQTSPFLDSDIVVAWDYGGVRDMLLARFPDRTVIEKQGAGNQTWFADEAPPES